jgi:hypothetical protein
MVIGQTVFTEIADDFTGDTGSTKKVKKGIMGGKILENLKNTLSDIFDESDVKM